MDQAVQAVVGVTVPGDIKEKGMYGTEGHSYRHGGDGLGLDLVILVVVSNLHDSDGRLIQQLLTAELLQVAYPQSYASRLGFLVSPSSGL